MKSSHYFLLGLTSALAMVAIIAAAVLTRSYTYQGSQIDPPLPVTNFQLTGQEGQPVSFNELWSSGVEARVVLIFFGYTHCPDVCPITLAEFKKIRAQLEGQAERVRFAFITVDPERDTPEILSRYVALFDPEFIGLTGSREQLEPVWKFFGVYQEKQDPDSESGYLVNHSSRIYALDQKGNLRLTYTFGTEPEVITQDVIHLLNER